MKLKVHLGWHPIFGIGSNGKIEICPGELISFVDYEALCSSTYTEIWILVYGHSNSHNIDIDLFPHRSNPKKSAFYRN